MNVVKFDGVKKFIVEGFFWIYITEGKDNDDLSGEYVPLAEYERLQSVLKELMGFNRLRNDRDAYLLALSEWGLKGKWGVDGEFSERPERASFGLE